MLLKSGRREGRSAAGYRALDFNVIDSLILMTRVLQPAHKLEQRGRLFELQGLNRGSFNQFAGAICSFRGCILAPKFPELQIRDRILPRIGNKREQEHGVARE